MLNSKDIEWSNENLSEMSSLEEESIEPPRKVARSDKVGAIMISLLLLFFNFAPVNSPQLSGKARITFKLLILDLTSSIRLVN